MDRGAAKTVAFVVVEGNRRPIPSHGVRVGRAPDNDIVLDDPNVSRQHLVLWSTPSGVYLRDLGSQNGTYIGPRRAGAGPEELPPGARIRVGRSELLIERRVVADRPTEPRVVESRAVPRGAPAGRTSAPIENRGAPRRPDLLTWGIATALFGLVALTGWVVFRAMTVDPIANSNPSPSPAITAPVVGSPAPAPVVIAPASPAQPSGPGRDPGLVRALAGAVRIVVPSGPNQANAGSGTVITSRGHILTNYHVVSHETNGELLNEGQGIVVAVPPGEGEAARPKFLARVVESDRRLDFALLRVDSAVGGGALPTDLGLTPIPIGDSETVRIGDMLTIVGYPALGGQGVTVTRGIHSGLQTFPTETGVFFKTDTEINPGNSGGSAIDVTGRLVGVPTAGRVSRDAVGKIGLVRPINLARPLVERANADR